MAAARAFVERYWAQMFDDPSGAEMRDAKTRLQEWAQARARLRRAGLSLDGPHGPDHAPRFVMEAVVEGDGAANRRGRLQARSRTGRGGQAAGAGRNAMTTRCGFCAIIGAPNAGKSTLTNALVGSKVAIVSPKVQTTRMTVQRRGHGRRHPDRVRRHARHLPAPPPAGPRHGGRRLGGRRRCRCHPAGGGCRRPCRQCRTRRARAIPTRSWRA